MMLPLVPDTIENYAVCHSSAVPELLEELCQFTLTNTQLPQMQVGPIEGNFLKILVRLTRAKRVLEVGTFTGYSALMMASGLPENGELITCEINPDHAAIARDFFDRSPWREKIQIKLGPASETLSQLVGPFDMAFIDADKEGYIDYFETIRPMMRPGGLIVIDNVLWSGKVLEEKSSQAASTQAIVAFNQHIQKLDSLDHIMLSVRDGMTLIII